MSFNRFIMHSKRWKTIPQVYRVLHLGGGINSPALVLLAFICHAYACVAGAPEPLLQWTKLPGRRKQRRGLILDALHHKASHHRKLEAGLCCCMRPGWVGGYAGDMLCYFDEIDLQHRLTSHLVISWVTRGLTVPAN